MSLKEIARLVGGKVVEADTEVTAGIWGDRYDENDTAADTLHAVRFDSDEEVESDPKVQKRIGKGVVKFVAALQKPLKNDEWDSGYIKLRAMIGWLRDNPGTALRFVKLADYKKALRAGLSNFKNIVLKDRAFTSRWDINNLKAEYNLALKVLKASGLKAVPVKEASPKKPKLARLHVDVDGTKGFSIAVDPNVVEDLIKSLKRTALKFKVA